MQHLDSALNSLEQALASPLTLQHSWRHLVRERLAGVQDALTAEDEAATDTWLAARVSHLDREHDRLLSRLRVLGATIGDATDLESVRQSLTRLVVDVHHHQQRLNDLAYDAVAMEVGGSD
jgi:hypothetical protein